MEPTDNKALGLQLSFELDHRLISIGELNALAPGYTFVLACDAKAPVNILVNGIHLAQGSLVDINGRLGVQVTQPQ